jgi:hypothetical protein
VSLLAGRGGDAFGLRISSNALIDGLEPLPRRPAREVTIDVVDARGALGRRGDYEILYRAGPERSPYLLIDHRPGGYGIWSPRLGRYLVSDDGREIKAAPARERWPWRLLFAQALPIAAAIQGLEVIHASGVDWHGGVIAIVAPSGWGKSTLAAALVRRGAKFVADDVVALEESRAGVLSHPGVGITNVSSAAMRKGVAHERVIARLSKYHLAVTRAREPLPLRALVFLERPEAKLPAYVERVSTPDPFRLLGSTFVFVVREPARLISQLDIHHRIAATVPVLNVRLPWTTDPDLLVDTIEPHLP